MEKVAGFLQGIFYIATADGNQPRVRAFDSAMEYNGGIYFETVKTKSVYKQLIANPKIEIFVMDDNGVMRLCGEAVEEGDAEVARTVEERIGKYLDNPDLAIFKLVNSKAHINNSDGSQEEIAF